MTARLYRHQSDVEAIQWDGTPERAVEIIEWVLEDQTEGPPRFLLLGTAKANEILGERGDITVPIRVDQWFLSRHRQLWEAGATAALLLPEMGWVSVLQDWWVMKDTKTKALYLNDDAQFQGRYGLLTGSGIYDSTKTQMSIDAHGLKVTVEYPIPGPELHPFDSELLLGLLDAVEYRGAMLFERRDPEGYRAWLAKR